MALSLQRYTRSDFDRGLNLMLKERVIKERERSIVIAAMIGDALPENVIVEILSWLPVKALLQFKSVCKSWYAIISSPDFISMHLQNYYKHNDGDSLCFLFQYYVTHGELLFVEALLDENPQVVAHEILYEMPMYGSDVCGPCDGLYYLYDYNCEEHGLWNPAINELKTLPPITITKPNLPSDLIHNGCGAFGFGLDPKSKDYKVVVFVRYWTRVPDDDDGVSVYHPWSIFVYSLRTNSWRYCCDLAQDCEVQKSKCYTFVDGCYYWLGSCARYENPELIVSFDIANDACHEICVPNYDQPASNALAIYHESLAFLAVHENESRFDIWTRNEGVWTKKFSTGPILEVWHPLGQWKNNMFVLECVDHNLLLCDPDMRDIKDLGFKLDFERYRPCEAVWVYRESLVSIKDSSRCCLNEEVETDTSP